MKKHILLLLLCLCILLVNTISIAEHAPNLNAGTTSGNLQHFGIAAEDEDSIYFLGSDGLY